MDRFRMTRIGVPSWSKRPDVLFRNVRLSEYRAIRRNRARMLDVVHQEVEAYLNTPGLYAEHEDDGFPNRSQMSGEYYVGDESYAGHVGPVWFQIGIMCHCLERASRLVQVDRDYLGLEVWLRCEPSDWSFSIFRNTDSSSI